MTRVLGIDPSLTALGYAMTEEVVGVFRSRAKGMRRLAEIRNFVIEMAHDCDVTILEGYAFARTNQAHQLGELGGVVRLALWERRIPFVDVPPAIVKKVATGRGNADKPAVIAAAIRRFGFEGDGQDAAEAWILRAMALVHYDNVPIPLPAGALDALEKVEWPALKALVAEEA